MLKIVYVVTNEDALVYASICEEDAESYADTKNYEAREAVLKERGIDDPNEEDLAEAAFTAGYEGDFYKFSEVDLETAEDGTICLDDGTELDVDEINKYL